MNSLEFFDQLKQDLHSLASLGGKELENSLERIMVPLEPILHRRVSAFLCGIAEELSTTLPNGRIEPRYQGDEITLVFVADELPPVDPNTEMSARITLRLPNELKELIEGAATVDGVSLNSWLLRTVQQNSHSPNYARRQLRGRGKS
jgi:hypothetical protein